MFWTSRAERGEEDGEGGGGGGVDETLPQPTRRRARAAAMPIAKIMLTAIVLRRSVKARLAVTCLRSINGMGILKLVDTDSGRANN